MKKLVLLIAMLPLTVFAQHVLPKNVKLVPIEKSTFPSEMKNDMITVNRNQKLMGFSQSDSDEPRKLLRMGYEKQPFVEGSASEKNGLKKSVGEIRTSFKYKNVVPDVIGHVPLGMYTQKGWAGIKTFFDGKRLGTCSLSVFYVAEAKEPMQLNPDGLTFVVNNKPTRVSVEGSHNSGFMYSVRWYDENYVRDLECANMKLDKDISKKMVVMARKVDEGMIKQ